MHGWSQLLDQHGHLQWYGCHSHWTHSELPCLSDCCCAIPKRHCFQCCCDDVGFTTGNGVCVGPQGCVCSNGYTGLYCEIPPQPPTPNPTPSSASSTSSAPDGTGGSSSNSGAVAGGVIGALAVVGVAGAVFYWRFVRAGVSVASSVLLGDFCSVARGFPQPLFCSRVCVSMYVCVCTVLH